MSGPSHSRPSFGHRLSLVALGTLFVGGCAAAGPSELALPDGAVPMTARAEYQAWFAKTEACSGLTGQYDVVQWFVVPNVETFPTAEGPKVGMWERSGRTAKIIIAGRYVGHEMVVRHEMLHHLLDREGHPADFFVERCRLTWESWSASAD